MVELFELEFNKLVKAGKAPVAPPPGALSRSHPAATLQPPPSTLHILPANAVNLSAGRASFNQVPFRPSKRVAQNSSGHTYADQSR